MPPAVTRPYQLAASPAFMQPLARLQFGAAAGESSAQIGVPLPVLQGPAQELWYSAKPVRPGIQDGLGFAENGDVLFGHLHLTEPELMRVGLSRAVFHAYARIEHVLHSQGFPHWLRIWNFLERITDGSGDDERYRQFSLGRYKALALKPGFERALPAATAIGMPHGGLVIYFLAAKIAGQQVENPRQVSAFAYPRQYGPKSPSFSRATLVPWADGAELLVSGTASVVGHQTLHIGDPVAQLEETFRNLAALVAEAARLHGCAPEAFVPEAFKLYVRSTDYAAAAHAYCRSQLPAHATLTVLLGDVCRSDLAVEIEGNYRIGLCPA